MKDDMGQLFEKMLKQYTETKCGSERSQVLLDAICKRLPKIYREMIDDYRKGAKKQEKKQEKDEQKKIANLHKETDRLRKELESLQNGTYRDKLDDSDYEDSDSVYSSDEDSRYGKKKPKKKQKAAIGLQERLEQAETEKKEMEEAEVKEKKKVEDLNAEILKQENLIAKKKQDMLELEEKEKTESKLFKNEFPHLKNRDSEVSEERDENKLIDDNDVDYDNTGA